jgi:hypothetical protein
MARTPNQFEKFIPKKFIILKSENEPNIRLSCLTEFDSGHSGKNRSVSRRNSISFEALKKNPIF